MLDILADIIRSKPPRRMQYSVIIVFPLYFVSISSTIDIFHDIFNDVLLFCRPYYFFLIRCFKNGWLFSDGTDLIFFYC